PTIRIENIQFTDTAGNIITADTLNISDPNNLPLPLYNLGTATGEGLYGSQYSETFDGKAGNDTIIGYQGNDTYLYNMGDGKDTIMEESGNNTDTTTQYGTDRIRFGIGITQARTLLYKVGNDLIIKFKDSAGNISTTDQITINNQFASNGNVYRIESLEFNNGDTTTTSLDISNPNNYSYTDIGVGGTAGDDSISLTSAFNGLVETFDGNDYINASYPADYNIDSGAGNDIIYTSGGNDTIKAGDGDDYIQAGEGNNNVDSGAGNDNITAGAGNDIIKGGDGNDIIYSGAGDDIISGGKGDDNISYNNSYVGNPGNDTYLYSKGDGNDIIAEGYSDYASWGYYSATNNNDTIRFDSTISKNDIILVRSGTNLIIKFKDSAGNISTTDSITINGQLSASSPTIRIENIQFTDTAGNIITADTLNISDPNNLPL
ncbi:calcium-binding protein, partial [bacterium]|nr:calcium-binding protein [bacterium]